jgi:hypothetical protein
MKVKDFIKELTDRFDENDELNFSTYTEISKIPVPVDIWFYGGNKIMKLAHLTFGSEEFRKL